jgi:predicted ATPase/class 3 adenylate cyclase
VGAPSGTVTFLFTDIEGSTLLWEEHRASMAEHLERHDSIVRNAIEANNGFVFSTGGDGMTAAFERAPDALNAAIQAQRGLQQQVWEPEIRVRMGLHTGDTEERGGDYFGPPLNRCARLMAAAHGGQILCSGTTSSLLSGHLPDDVTLRDLGAHRLRDLAEPLPVVQVDHPDLRSAFPPLRSLDTYSGNLPSQRNSFVGRDAEIAQVSSALGEARVVTLCGVGGVGKTRLSLSVAAGLLPQFPDGAWLVRLASVTSKEGVLDAIASSLGMQTAPGASLEQSLLDYLKVRSLLLILDNCEHLPYPIAEFVDLALDAAPGLKVLATSRKGLSVAAEHRITVPSLRTPDETMTTEQILCTDGVGLFVVRARQTSSTFNVTEDNAREVGELCRRLDGIPLAIELAAARVGVMTPNEILEHLDMRFKLLTTGRRAAVSKHQTLHNALDWSHDLLEETERQVFRRLSVFDGDFDLRLAKSVVADDDLDEFEVGEILFKLVDKSLVEAQPGDSGTRFRLLETIRDYARERLIESGDGEVFSRRHFDRYLSLAQELAPELWGSQEMDGRVRIEREQDNFRAALRWAVDADEVAMAFELVDALGDVGSIRSPLGTLPLEAARMPGASTNPFVAVALASAAAAFSARGDQSQAAPLAEDALAAAHTTKNTPSGNHILCRVFENICMVQSLQSDHVRFLEMGRSYLRASEDLGDALQQCQALMLIGSLSFDPEEAFEACEASVALARELGSRTRLAYSSVILGARLASVDVDRAEAVFAEALQNARAVRNDWLDQFATLNLALLQARKGDLDNSARTLLDSVTRMCDKGDLFGLPQVIHYLAFVVASLGKGDTALLMTSWSNLNSESFDTSHPFVVGLDRDYNLVEKVQSDSEKDRCLEKAAGLDAAQLIAIIRADLERQPVGPIT